MSTTGMHTVCPWCLSEHDAASGLNHDTTPKPGDVTLCIRCGEWCVFDDRMTLRKPGRALRYAIARNPDCEFIRAAWLASREPS
jgi:hypothetical protein